MLNRANKNYNSEVFDSLVRELKRPLILMSKQAELNQSAPDKEHMELIRRTAEKALRLIDSYLLTAQSEYGQQLLPVESFGIGSVIYNVAEEIRPIAEKANIDVVLNINDALVETNKEGLRAAIWCLSEMALDQASSEQEKASIEINARKTADNVRISVLTKAMKVKNSDIRKAQKNFGKTHMALSSSSSESGIRLAVAGLLGESLGTSLKAVKEKNTQGLGFNLSLSSQLQLGIG